MGPPSFRQTLQSDHPDFPSAQIGADGWERLERLAEASPLYGQMLAQEPALCLWLEDPVRQHPFGPGSFRASWNNDPPNPDEEDPADRLRRWRRRMSLRIAYRSVNGQDEEPATVAELTGLAEFCLAECLERAFRQWTERLGEPWDEESGRPARFCVLALGKLGGGELNFSSDIDLIYCYEGEGHCRRQGQPTSVTTPEYFTKVAETVTSVLTARTGAGFLFRVDVRLRPDGAWGPLVQSLSALENYYATLGQTWERLALIKARPVAGDLALGAELLEDLHSFRYPRRPPPALLAEVAAMKARTEREVVGQAALDRDIKRGPGGIREIEFIAQSMQLLHAGRYPFLQTASTAPALEGLARYDLLPAADARSLIASYWHLRRVEHRLQMRDESQTHLLPPPGAELEAVARSLDFAGAEAFAADLEARRGTVRALYASLFSDRPFDADFEAWWDFFTGRAPAPAAAARLARWFGPDPAAAESIRLFVVGGHVPQVTPDLVHLFQHLAPHFDQVMPELARPRQALARLGQCAERYGTRRRFLEICAGNPPLLRALALVCDRSAYGVELLCAHPEIMEEVLRPEMLRREKTANDLAEELRAGAGRAPGDAFAPWLWLYVRAEQLRYSLEELLGFIDREKAEASLAALAEAVLRHILGGADLAVVGLGKLGAGELTFGSDLDLLFVAEEGGEARAAAEIGRLRRILNAGNPLGPTFALDLRLRPHGDAGPLASALSGLAAYHASAAQTWEKQALTRARVVAGPSGLADRFRTWVSGLLYGAPLPPRQEAEIWAMRRRIERERDVVSPPRRAFKTGPGGLIDVEFLVQAMQLRHGASRPELRVPGTRAGLEALERAGLIPGDAADKLRGNFGFLRQVEFCLRRDSNRPESVLPESPADREPLARWLGFPGEAAFWSEHTARMAETRFLVGRVAPGSRLESQANP